jgi:hypothetical protein
MCTMQGLSAKNVGCISMQYFSPQIFSLYGLFNAGTGSAPSLRNSHVG